MAKIEIIDNERTLEEIRDFSGYVFEQSKLNPTIAFKNNVFLTSLLVGASLVSTNEASATESFKFENSNKNEITTTCEYNETINQGLVKYIHNINVISKRKISKNSLLKSILSFKSLTESWDGYGAVPLEIESATNSIQLLDLIGENIFCTISDFHPNPNGTITFEWENSENEMVSLEIGNNSFSYFVEMASTNVMFFNNKLINAKEAKKLSEFIQAI
ncbi:hypothetical protein [Polaribacter sp. Hel_I_88]|uniref:hypothetical protein n=1 Tax=Polaribacter sp. Hel_I_88 TaxID=1250006 RepID=UPI00047DF885|nr:hypothetical protein [Polaribacter sp. Hel_I_88]